MKNCRKINEDRIYCAKSIEPDLLKLARIENQETASDQGIEEELMGEE
jgi:hypothetical protein